MEARNIIATIPKNITVTNDRENRIQSAFSKVFSSYGFKSGGNNTRYSLRVTVKTSPVDLPNNQHKFVLMELNANLIDNNTKETLLPYSFSNREGHMNQSGAENRAFISAENIIAEEYGEVLGEYLAGLGK